MHVCSAPQALDLARSFRAAIAIGKAECKRTKYSLRLTLSKFVGNFLGRFLPLSDGFVHPGDETSIDEGEILSYSELVFHRDFAAYLRGITPIGPGQSVNPQGMKKARSG